MMSKGGKKLYLCPNCGSARIYQLKAFGQNSGDCGACDTYWPWSWRLKVSMKNISQVIKRDN